MNTVDIIEAFIDDMPEKINIVAIRNAFIENIDISIAKGFSHEQNTIYLNYSSNNEVTAESIKVYNVLIFSQIEFVSTLSVILSSGLIINEAVTKGVVATTSALLSLSLVFLQNIKKKFSSFDSSVLASIYFLQSPSNIIQIKEKYESLFSRKISDVELENSINLLIEYKTIDYDITLNLISLKEEVLIKRV